MPTNNPQEINSAPANRKLDIEFTHERHESHKPEALLLTLKESSAALNVSEKSVRRLIDRGLIKANPALRHIRISRAEIERFAAETK